MTKRIFYYATSLVGFLFIAGIRIAQAAVSLPDFSKTSDLPGFISSVYSFALTVVGIAVFIRILYAGFLMLTAAGNSSKWGDARTKMQNAIIGAILLFSAYLILYVINPDLVRNTFNFRISTSSPPPSGVSQTTPPTSGPAQLTGTVSAGSAFKIVPMAHAAGYYFNLKVVDADGNSCTKAYNLEVLSETSLLTPSQKTVVAIKKGNISDLFVAKASDDCSNVNFSISFLPDAVEGRGYYTEIPAMGGRTPYTFSITGGELPAGLRLTANMSPPRFVGSAPTPTPSGSPNPAFVPTYTPLVIPKTGNAVFDSFCATQISSCPMGGYTFMAIQGCAAKTNSGNSCYMNSYCASNKTYPSSTCYMLSDGSCGCQAMGSGIVGSCCWQMYLQNWATEETANKIAQCLGGTVIVDHLYQQDYLPDGTPWGLAFPIDRSGFFTADFAPTDTQYYILLPNGNRQMAGLLARQHDRTDIQKPEADRNLWSTACYARQSSALLESTPAPEPLEVSLGKLSGLAQIFGSVRDFVGSAPNGLYSLASRMLSK